MWGILKDLWQVVVFFGGFYIGWHFIVKYW